MSATRGNGDEEPPPILGTWSRVYALVIAVLVLDIVLLTLLTWSMR